MTTKVKLGTQDCDAIRASSPFRKTDFKPVLLSFREPSWLTADISDKVAKGAVSILLDSPFFNFYVARSPFYSFALRLDDRFSFFYT